jgi:hypothetical protein
VTRVRIYDSVSEGGPEGPPLAGWLAEDGRQRWLFQGGREAAEAAWRDPERPGWQPFFGIVLAPDVVARAWHHCVSAPEGDWWEPPKTTR